MHTRTSKAAILWLLASAILFSLSLVFFCTGLMKWEEQVSKVGVVAALLRWLVPVVVASVVSLNFYFQFRRCAGLSVPK